MGSPSTAFIHTSLPRHGRGYDVGGLLSSHFDKKLAPAFDDVRQSMKCPLRLARPVFQCYMGGRLDRLWRWNCSISGSEGDLTTTSDRGAPPVQGEPPVLLFRERGGAGGTDGGGRASQDLVLPRAAARERDGRGCAGAARDHST